MDTMDRGASLTHIFWKSKIKQSHVYKLIHDKPHLFKKQYTFELLYKELFSKILDKYGVDSSEKEYIFSYFSLGLVALIQKWIEKDCQDEIEMIASIMKKVIRYEN